LEEDRSVWRGEVANEAIFTDSGKGRESFLPRGWIGVHRGGIMRQASCLMVAVLALSSLNSASAAGLEATLIA